MKLAPPYPKPPPTDCGLQAHPGLDLRHQEGATFAGVRACETVDKGDAPLSIWTEHGVRPLKPSDYARIEKRLRARAIEASGADADAKRDGIAFVHVGGVQRCGKEKVSRNTNRESKAASYPRVPRQGGVLRHQPKACCRSDGDCLAI